MLTSAPRFMTCAWNRALLGHTSDYSKRANLHITRRKQPWECTYLMDCVLPMPLKICQLSPPTLIESTTTTKQLIPPSLNKFLDAALFGNSTILSPEKNSPRLWRSSKMQKHQALPVSYQKHLKLCLLPTYDKSTNMSMTFSLAVPTMNNGTKVNAFPSQKAETSLIQTNGEV